MVLNQVGLTRVRNWEQTFSSWAQGPGKTENEKCENAIRAIKDAIQSSEKLRNRNINVFLQGSYRNRVNVRQDSDVDVGILCFDTFFYDLPDGTTKETFNIIPASYHYAQFKDEVQEALVEKFGSDSVKRGNKAFDIKANSYRVDADVAPFFEHRRYYQSRRYESGVELLPDNGGRVINWPEQHYENGVSKNDLCNRRYKRAVRIVKKLCIEMQENKISEANPIPGFLLECLVWNMPNEYF